MSSLLVVQYLGPHAFSNDRNIRIPQVTVACISVHSTQLLVVWVGASVHLIIWFAY